MSPRHPVAHVPAQRALGVEDVGQVARQEGRDAARPRAAAGGCGERVGERAVVGILGAALYSPVFTSAIADLRDFALALAGFVALMVWKAPPWFVVAFSAAGGAILVLLD